VPGGADKLENGQTFQGIEVGDNSRCPAVVQQVDSVVTFSFEMIEYDMFVNGAFDLKLTVRLRIADTVYMRQAAEQGPEQRNFLSS